MPDSGSQRHQPSQCHVSILLPSIVSIDIIDVKRISKESVTTCASHGVQISKEPVFSKTSGFHTFVISKISIAPRQFQLLQEVQMVHC